MKTSDKFEKVIVLGNGRSGKSARDLLVSEGSEVLVLEDGETSFDQFCATVSEFKPQLAVVSPGFAIDHAWLNHLRSNDIPLIAELELGWSRFVGKTIAVTGSNGKSSAVKWICEALRSAGFSAEIGGNYGIPACEVAMNSKSADWLVLEISSFQLETIKDFKADAAIVLNWLPNHLNRHGTMEEYLRMKARIFENADSSDFCWIPKEIENDVKSMSQSKGTWKTFGSSDSDAIFSNGSVCFEESSVDLSGTYFDNPTLGPATGASVSGLLLALGVPKSAIEKSAREFESLPHRAQKCAEKNGVVFINDSKATNLAAMAAAIKMQSGPVRLIAGGLIKEKNLNLVKEVLAEKCIGLYLIGDSAKTMQNAWESIVSCYQCETLERAINMAWKDSQAGDVILLSPACASFDQFKSFEQLGEHFMAFAKALVEESAYE